MSATQGNHHRAFAGILALIAGAAAWGVVRADAADPFPQVGPPDRVAAGKVIAARRGVAGRCLTPALRVLERNAPVGHAPSTVGALALLRDVTPLLQERTFEVGPGIRVRYTTNALSPDRIDATDGDGNGTPDVVDAVAAGLGDAVGRLGNELSFPRPSIAEVLLVDLGRAADGYLLDPVEGRQGAVVVLNASAPGGPSAVRAATIHQYAHAVARELATFFPVDWDEAFAVWTVVSLNGAPDDATSALFSERLEEMRSGLLEPEFRLAGGNALWLSFLEESYGRAAVRTTIEELATGAPAENALDRALRRVSTDGLRAAFREFHLWTLLVGHRSSGRHFSFGAILGDPVFASSADSLPALSVHDDPALGPLGLAQVRLATGGRTGGLHVRFEGEFTARWEADLLLVRAHGALQRVPVSLAPEGWGELTVPLQDVDEAILLFRNLGSDDGAPHTYSYAADEVPGFPFRLGALEAVPVGPPTPGILVSWETASELGVVGYDLLRRREDGGPETVVTEVRVPALGDESHPTAYHYLDRSAEPGVRYVYRIRGVTPDGLVSSSRPLHVASGHQP